MKLLFAEDTKELSRAVCVVLEHSGYEVDPVYDGEEAMERIRTNVYDGVILDIMMPGKTGLEVLTEMRNANILTPVLMLTAKAEIDDRVVGLDAGADDYLTKPFGVMELIARVKAVLRRTMEEDKFLTLGDIFLDDEKHMVYVKDVPCSLTFKEYELLKLLLHNAGIVVTREIILERVWGIDFEGESRTLDMHIRTLRQKLGEAGSMIRTVRNVGYMIE